MAKTDKIAKLDLTHSQSTTPSEPANGQLKHLNFVSDAAERASSVSDTLYKQARSYTPASAEKLVSNVEQTVAAYAAPVFNKASDVGEKVLNLADDQVDYVTSGKYLNYLSDKLSPSKNLTRVKNVAYSLTDHLIDPDAAIGKAQAVWNRFTSVPAVNKTLAAFEPLTKWGQGSFATAHDWLVNSWYYKRAIDLSGSSLAWATTTTPYKLSTRYLYPWVQPVADPAIGKLSSSKSLSSAINYWKPAATV